MSGARLPRGGRIDRSRPMNFRFDGRSYTGYAGDTLASAMLANGVSVINRSFKYHRPRGIMTAGSEEPCGLVQLESGAVTQPNLRTTQVELYDGLSATGMNGWPNVNVDLGVANAVLSKFLVAGFYYKTFKWPGFLWKHVYEPVIRRMAGIGKAPTAPDPDIYDKMHIHADVMVCGGGPAGLAAALAAARTGARVVLADEQNEFGGALLGGRDRIDGKPALQWVEETLAELRGFPEVRLLPRTTVFGYYDHNFLSAVERRTDHLGPAARPGEPRQRLWHVRAKRVVLATGAHERPLVFADNDRPGVMLAESVRTYVNRYGVAPGQRVVVFTNNDGAYRTAIDLAEAGITVAAVVDLRDRVTGALPAEAGRRGIEVLAGHAVVATRGDKRISGVEVMRLTGTGDGVTGPARAIACDLVAMSGGWTPAVHLFSQSQGKLRFDEEMSGFVPNLAVQPQESAGACQGTFDLAGCLAEGLRAGAAMAASAGFGDGTAPAVPATDAVAEEKARVMWVVPGKQPVGHGKQKHFVDFQSDVTVADVRLAAREGMHSVEHLKRYTATGMGTDQGKTSNVNALALLSKEVGRTIAKTGTTTFRAPYTPVTFGVLAGRDLGQLSDPVRVTAIHPWHVEHGALFEDVGQWKRPWYFPRSGEDLHAAVRRECAAVRTGVGVMDASTLGKIDIQGPDAAEFLNRVYTNAWKKLGINRARYGVMCKEDGMVFDDGVTTRLGENHFLMTTTTGGAARVLDWLEEYLQTEWPELKVYCTSVTEQWSTVAVVGPRSREVVRHLAPDMDLSNEAFPFMARQDGVIAGVKGFVARISFSGELAFEINVPAHYGLAMWKAVMAAGRPYDITPYGTETMHVLRAEKGYIIVGQDTDGTQTPQDLAMEWIVAKSKGDFIGKRSFDRADTRRADRKQLVGLLPDDPEEVLPEGAQLVLEPSDAVPVRMVGHVTSSYYSPALGRSFALALVKGGASRHGSTVHAPLPGKTVRATITDPVMFDKEGSRRDG